MTPKQRISNVTSTKSLQVTCYEFVDLLQTLINFVPSRDINTNRYFCLDNLFSYKFNLNNPYVKNYITYNCFVKLVTSNKISSGLYPVVDNSFDSVHYYIVISTKLITIPNLFTKWFSSRKTKRGYIQDSKFVKDTLKYPYVIINGYIKGKSPLDNTFKNQVGHISLGANIQPSQSLCAFNAALLGLAFGLPACNANIKDNALHVCLKLKAGPLYYKTNERHVLTFLYNALCDTTNGIFEPEESFIYNLAIGANTSSPNLQQVTKAKKLLCKINNFPVRIKTTNGINMLSIFKIILDKSNSYQFNYWSQSY